MTLKEKNPSDCIALAKELTLAIIAQIKPQEGTGERWGRDVAECFETVFKKVGNVEVS